MQWIAARWSGLHPVALGCTANSNGMKPVGVEVLASCNGLQPVAVLQETPQTERTVAAHRQAVELVVCGRLLYPGLYNRGSLKIVQVRLLRPGSLNAIFLLWTWFPGVLQRHFWTPFSFENVVYQFRFRLSPGFWRFHQPQVMHWSSYSHE
jgi:hypothetical protein